MYTIATHVENRGADTSSAESASSIPEALAILARRLVAELPYGPVAWMITDPDGGEHRGCSDLRGRLDQVGDAVRELVQDLYAQLHRAADGGVDLRWLSR
jgi:hypothetical protein